MIEPWLTIVPIYNLWSLPDELQLPFSLNKRASLSRLPDWLTDEQQSNVVDLLLPKVREELKAHGTIRYCIVVEYQADSLGSTDPQWQGQKTRSIQDSAFEDARNFFLALWLVHPTSIHYRQVVHVANRPSDRLIRQIEKYDPQRHLPNCEDDEYQVSDLERARLIANGLSDVPINGNIRTAVHAVMRAQTEGEWTIRFLIFWLVMESLYGPEDGREITFRLSQRVAIFLSSNSVDAKNTFRRVKASYSWRSKLVHGLRLAKLTEVESTKLIIELEECIRDSLIKILSDDSLLATFDGSAREQFLDELVFK
jgi:hypothetical protein